jgi:hypothetical protein
LTDPFSPHEHSWTLRSLRQRRHGVLCACRRDLLQRLSVVSVSTPLRMMGKASSRRRTGGERPARERHQSTRNDNKRQG